MASFEGVPASPCNGVCRLDAARTCLGCGRRMSEIIEWPGASTQRKHEIIAAASERMSIIGRDPEHAP